MSYLIRVGVALAGGLAVLAVVLTVLGFLMSREPAVLSGDGDRSYWTRVDFEQVRSGVIVPVDAAAAASQPMFASDRQPRRRLLAADARNGRGIRVQATDLLGL